MYANLKIWLYHDMLWCHLRAINFTQNVWKWLKHLDKTLLKNPHACLGLFSSRVDLCPRGITKTFSATMPPMRAFFIRVYSEKGICPPPSTVLNHQEHIPLMTLLWTVDTPLNNSTLNNYFLLMILFQKIKIGDKVT